MKGRGICFSTVIRQKKYISYWNHTLQHSHKLNFYYIIKANYSPAAYLDVTRKNPSRKNISETENKQSNNNNELYLHDHTNTYSIARAIFRNQNYNTGQSRYFDNNLSRTSKQAEIYFMNCILIK